MRRAFQWDLARQLERLDWMEAQLPRYAAWGYQEVHLHLENAVEYPSYPGVARPGALSRRQFERLIRAADRVGIGVVPIVNLLGHTQYLLQDPALRDLNERRAADGSPLETGQICPVHPRTLDVADRLLRDMAPYCTAGKVHVGLDESYHLGRHPLSRREISRIGMAAHFARYVGRLHALAGGLGLRLGLWADMLALLPSAVPLLPEGVIAYDWYYYPFERLPRLEPRQFATYDLAGPLRARGIEYWGCPMSGAFRREPMPCFGERLTNAVSWWRRCLRTGAGGFLVTSWEPGSLAAESAMAVDAAIAGLWLDGEEDPRRLLQGGCRRLFGSRRGRAAARALAGADRRPFLGYWRWRGNDRWDVAAADEPLAPWSSEARACRRLAGAPGLPPAVAASLRFRAYLAERDLFVREAASGVWHLRRAMARGDGEAGRRLVAALAREAARFQARLTSGRAAARAMWRRSRSGRGGGPNEALVQKDAGRLWAWRAWLKRCQSEPEEAKSASPVAGAWQLAFTVENFAPAIQKVVVETKDGGRWAELDGLFAIEFQAHAARPRAKISHRIAVSLSSLPGAPPPAQPLRIAVRGIGQLRVRDLVISDGVRMISESGKAVLGSRVSKAGFPDFDWSRNRGAALKLSFGASAPASTRSTKSIKSTKPIARAPHLRAHSGRAKVKS